MKMFEISDTVLDAWGKQQAKEAETRQKARPVYQFEIEDGKLIKASHSQTIEDNLILQDIDFIFIVDGKNVQVDDNVKTDILKIGK